MPVRVRGVKRSVDDVILRAVVLHKAGMGWAEIGALVGWTRSRIFMAVSRVIKADVKEAPYWGDDQEEVKRFWK